MKDIKELWDFSPIATSIVGFGFACIIASLCLLPFAIADSIANTEQCDSVGGVMVVQHVSTMGLDREVCIK